MTTLEVNDLDTTEQRGAPRDGQSGADRCDEEGLIDAVRQGSDEAFAELYVRHIDAVRRLARRLCRDDFEADDVVSEVFCNTLRALGSGCGPSDALRPYLLRSVRNTVIKVRTRADTGRADPAAPDTLDRPDDDDPYRAPGAVAAAFGAVSERHRRVLWSVEVEGIPTTAIAETEQVAAPAAASLAYRARRALRRAYIGASIPTPTARSCQPFRALIPSLVDGGLGPAKSALVEEHGEHCTDCAAALDRAQVLKSGLADTSPFAALFLVLRALLSLGGRAAAGAFAGAPVAAVAGTAALTLGLGALVEAETTPADTVGLADEKPLDADPVRTPVPIPTPDDEASSRSTEGESVDADHAPIVPSRPADHRSGGPDDRKVDASESGDVDRPVDSSSDQTSEVDEPSGVDPVLPDAPEDQVVDRVVDVVGTATDGVGDVTTDVVEVVDATTDVVDDVVTAVDDVVTVVDDTVQATTGVQVVHDVIDPIVEQPVTEVIDDTAAETVSSVNSTLGTVVELLETETSSGGLLDGLGRGD